MTLPVFDPPSNPHAGSKSKPEFKVLKAEFGNGYTQSTPTINGVRRVETLTWEKIRDEDAEAIMDFVTALSGCFPFLYTLPGHASPLKWTCEDIDSVRHEAFRQTVTMTIRQSFNLGT